MVDNNNEIIPDGFYKNKSGAICSIECSCGKKNAEIESCETCKPKPVGMTGWICPACGRGNSPFSSSCPCVPFPGSQFPITCQCKV